MPESGADHSLYLYRAVQFPDEWEKLNLIRENVVYGDTTPFKWKNHNYALSYDVGNAEEYHLVLLDLEEPANDCIFKRYRQYRVTQTGRKNGIYERNEY